jgi:IS5 family transposase
MRIAYQRLVTVTQASVRQARTLVDHLQGRVSDDLASLVEQMETLLPNVEQVIAQTVRRVFKGESVPAQEKLVSLFEPHSDIIRRKKPGKETEFGHKVWLDETDGGIVTRWLVLPGNPPETKQWHPAIDFHIQQFGRPPNQASADRGLYSAQNEAYAQERGVKRVILPKPGRKSDKRRQYEAQPWFRRGRRFHAGVEGRISVLKRKHGLDRACYHDEDGFARWVGWGVIANNLTKIGTHVTTQTG